MQHVTDCVAAKRFFESAMNNGRRRPVGTRGSNSGRRSGWRRSNTRRTTSCWTWKCSRRFWSESGLQLRVRHPGMHAPMPSLLSKLVCAIPATDPLMSVQHSGSSSGWLDHQCGACANQSNNALRLSRILCVCWCSASSAEQFYDSYSSFSDDDDDDDATYRCAFTTAVCRCRS